MLGRSLDAVELDLEGNPLDPSKSAPASVSFTPLNNDRKYGFPRLLAVDGDGRRVLYAVDTPFDPFRKKQQNGFFQRDLITGQVLTLSDRYTKDCCPDYLADGSVLMPPVPGTTERTGPDFCLKRLNPEDGSLLCRFPVVAAPMAKDSTCSFQLTPERDRILIRFRNAVNRQNEWGTCYYAMDGTLIRRWGSDSDDLTLLPGGRYAVSTTRGFGITDLETGETVYRSDAKGSVCIRPDGREIWCGDTRLLLEYDYSLSSGGQPPRKGV